MPSNIEIKARDRDPAALAAAAREMADGPARQFVQRDTFFRVTRGRLKLRECGAGSGELIWYDRPGGSGSRRSEYLISPVADADSLRALLGRADGVLRVVEKTRTLYRVGQTRIHLDDVVGLGRFVELEVVLRDGQPEEEGHAIAAALMARLGIDRADLLGEAYADMLPDPR